MHISAFNNKKSRVSEIMLFSDFKKKEVINLKNCQKLGRVTDFEFDIFIADHIIGIAAE